MSYTPINSTVFTTAYAAALAGMNMSSRDFSPSTASGYYTNLAAVAGAFAQQFDTSWNAATNTDLDSELAGSAIEAVWEATPPPSLSPHSTTPSTYRQMCTSLIAMISAASAYFTGQGITPAKQAAQLTVGSLIYGAFHNLSTAHPHFDGINVFTFANLVGSVYTLTRDVFFADGTLIDVGITVKTVGHRIFCNGTLTNNGTISCDGNTAIGDIGGIATAVGTVGIGLAGGNGGTNGVGLPGTDQTFGVGDAAAAGGDGGAGGANVGGLAGTYAGPGDVGGSHQLAALQFGYVIDTSDGVSPQVFVMGGGAGGGGGGSDDPGTIAGGGGGGGGVMGLFVFNLVNNGLISCLGGNGESASGNVLGNGGGGGGGGGGLLNCITRFLSGTGTMNVAGGIGGNPLGTGVAGAVGSIGHINSFSA